jgi:hypothetical protein
MVVVVMSHRAASTAQCGSHRDAKVCVPAYSSPRHMHDALVRYFFVPGRSTLVVSQTPNADDAVGAQSRGRANSPRGVNAPPSTTAQHHEPVSYKSYDIL